MSQIMEALKQAQAQRSAAATAGEVPAAPPEAQPLRRSGRAWRWVLAAALVGGLACWAWFEWGQT